MVVVLALAAALVGRTGAEDVGASTAGVLERAEAGVGCRLAEGAGVFEGCLSGPCDDGPEALRRTGALGLKPAPPFFFNMARDCLYDNYQVKRVSMSMSRFAHFVVFNRAASTYVAGENALVFVIHCPGELVFHSGISRSARLCSFSQDILQCMDASCRNNQQPGTRCESRVHLFVCSRALSCDKKVRRR